MIGISLGLTTLRGSALGPELVDIANLPAPTINAGGFGATSTWTAGTRTMAVTGAGTSNSYPRFTFAIPGLSAGKRYQVQGQITGDTAKMASSPAIRLATSGTANTIAYNSATGAFSATQASAGGLIEFLINGTQTSSITIASLSIREAP